MNILWEKVLVDPWWFAGGMMLVLLMVFFLLVSLYRHVRLLGWFYMAAVLVALLYVVLWEAFPFAVEWLASYRSDWSLWYVVQSTVPLSFVKELVFYAGLYGLTALSLLMVLEMFALITFRWKQMRVLWQRAWERHWFVVVFALANLVLNRVAFLLLGFVDPLFLNQVFYLLSFLFCFQLFLRLVDSAHLHTSVLLFEFSYVIGLLMVLVRFGVDWYRLIIMSSGTLHELLLSQLFLFFLAILMIGLFGIFYIKAHFASSFYLFRSASRVLSWLGNHSSFEVELILGTLIASGVGFLLLMVQWMGMILPLILLFFVAYFFLFALLDHQEDQRIRGDLVLHRVHSGRNKNSHFR